MSYSCTSFLFQGLQIYGIVKDNNALIVYFGNFSSEDGWFWPRL